MLEEFVLMSVVAVVVFLASLTTLGVVTSRYGFSTVPGEQATILQEAPHEQHQALGWD